ncbi:glycosyl hydrolase family 18 protein [Nocardioides sp. R-C-SC26]|uniref:glycosyl hydrolase family 18 protein n=1 Tax=Nocardioides sp. R-C-SC26 TaxID=2870414 RepID=UPI001E2B2B0C|nr:glycosyl hydrolase family 18 protein [Nocardioides sp. R-C-SC26]
MSLPRTLGLAAIALIVAGLPHAAPASADDETHGVTVGVAVAPPQVTGFALGSLRGGVVARDAEALDRVIVAGVALRADGRGIAPTTDAMRRVRRQAASRGLSTELILSNYSNATESFDPARAHRLLSSTRAITRVARTMARSVVREGWGGVNVDLERVRASDAAGLVSLLDRLQRVLPAERTVSLDVSAATSTAGYRARGYDLPRLADVADVIVVMAYDQHGPGWSPPGPIGALPWQRRAMAAALESVPAHQLDLGVAGYGYAWEGNGGRAHSAPGARRRVERAGVTPRWHRVAGEWSARLPGGAVLWWSDGRSYRLRLALAGELGLRGVAVWRLGWADALRP